MPSIQKRIHHRLHTRIPLRLTATQIDPFPETIESFGVVIGTHTTNPNLHELERDDDEPRRVIRLRLWAKGSLADRLQDILDTINQRQINQPEVTITLVSGSTTQTLPSIPVEFEGD